MVKKTILYRDQYGKAAVETQRVGYSPAEDLYGLMPDPAAGAGAVRRVFKASFMPEDPAREKIIQDEILTAYYLLVKKAMAEGDYETEDILWKNLPENLRMKSMRENESFKKLVA